MACGMQIKGWCYFSGLATCPWILHVCRRPMSLHLMSAFVLWLFVCCSSLLCPFVWACHSFSIRYNSVNSWTDDNNRCVLAEFRRHDVTFHVACLCAPDQNPNRDDFFAFCSSEIDPSVYAIWRAEESHTQQTKCSLRKSIFAQNEPQIFQISGKFDTGLYQKLKHIDVG